MRTEVGNKIIEIASEFVDLVEVRQNRQWSDPTKSGRGREDKIVNALTSVGWKSGNAYCMQFARYCYVNAHKSLGLSNDKDFKIIEACLENSSVNSYNSISKEGFAKDQPIIGSIFMMQRQDDKSKGHAGIVVDFNSEYFETIEGNTTQHNRVANVDLEVEGDGIYRKRRNFKKAMTSNSLRLLGFLHPLYASRALTTKEMDDGPEFAKTLFNTSSIINDVPPEIMKNIPAWMQTFESKIRTFSQVINS